MTEDKRIRQLRKQALCLRAQHHRLALGQDWAALSEPFAERGGSAGGASDAGRWLGVVGGLVSILPSKWSRILSVSVLAWRILGGVRSARATNPEVAAKSGPPPPI